MALNQESIEQASRHAVYVQRYAGGLANQFDPFLRQMRERIATALVMTPEQAFRRDLLLNEIESIMRAVFGDYNQHMEEQLDLFGVSESEWQARKLDEVTPTYEPVIPPPDQVITAFKSQPLIFEETNTAKLLEPFIRDWQEAEIRKANDAIRFGFATGQTNDQIARQIGDHLDKSTRRNNKAIVRTATTHVSNEARQTTLKENSDIVIGYIWLSTLDERTTATCKARDQQEFKWSDNFQPLPPAHPQCRSTTTPLLDGRYRLDDDRGQRASRGSDGPEPVGATSTYYGWLKRQSAAFQDDTIGPTRGRLLRNGGLTSEEFRRLSVDDKFRPLTLKQMQARDPEAFESAGIEL